jgi:hypothetical protein
VFFGLDIFFVLVVIEKDFEFLGGCEFLGGGGRVGWWMFVDWSVEKAAVAAAVAVAVAVGGGGVVAFIVR